MTFDAWWKSYACEACGRPLRNASVYPHVYECWNSQCVLYLTTFYAWDLERTARERQDAK